MVRWTLASCIAAAVGQLHSASAYPEALQQWDTVSGVLQDYVGAAKLMVGANLPHISYHRVKMQDGVGLDTIVINPYPYDQKKTACIVRSPYGPTTENLADIFTLTNGFAAVLQDQRGTFLSGGTFDMWRQAGDDVKATFEWINSQSWSNGEIVTAGASADGIAEAVEIIEAPKQLKAQWIMWATSDGHKLSFQDGAFREDLITGYLNTLSGLTHGASVNVIGEVKAHEAYSDWWGNLTLCHDPTNPQQDQCRYKNIKWPVLMLAGWWDIFAKTQLEAWHGMDKLSDASHRDDHVLIVAPLGHCLIGTPIHPVLAAAEAQSLTTSVKLSSELFSGITNGTTRSRIGRVNLFVMAGFSGGRTGNYWTSLDAFPTPTPLTLYLQPGALANSPMQAAASAVYTYDPSSPTPMVGGNNLPFVGSLKVCGTADQTDRDGRADVVVFDSGKLSEDTAIVGQVTATIYFSSDAPDTDVVVTLSDVSPSLFGTKVMLVRYGVQRLRWRDSDATPSPPLTANTVYAVDVDLAHTAYVFPKGHSIRVSVSSASAPFWNANDNTGAPVAVQGGSNSSAAVANNAIHMSVEHPSRVVLPVVALADIPENKAFATAAGTAAEETVVV